MFFRDTDYYPFGMQMPGRHFSAGNGYRFGFNGQEKDDEIKGEGNSLAFKYRIHDPRLGRFLSVDPLSKDYPWNSTYAFALNMPIQFAELEGQEIDMAGIFKYYLNKNWGWSEKNNDEKWVKQKANEIAVYSYHKAKDVTQKAVKSPLVWSVAIPIMVVSAPEVAAAEGVVSIGPALSTAGTVFRQFLAKKGMTMLVNSTLNVSSQLVFNGFEVKEVDWADVASAGISSVIPGTTSIRGFKINIGGTVTDAALSSAFDIKISGNATVVDGTKSIKDFSIDFGGGLVLGVVGDITEAKVNDLLDEKNIDDLVGSDVQLRSLLKGSLPTIKKLVTNLFKTSEFVGVSEGADKLKNIKTNDVVDQDNCTDSCQEQ